MCKLHKRHLQLKFTSFEFPKILWNSDNLSIASVNPKYAHLYVSLLLCCHRKAENVFFFRADFAISFSLHLMTTIFDLRYGKRNPHTNANTHSPKLVATRHRYGWPKFQKRQYQRLNLLYLFGFYCEIPPNTDNDASPQNGKKIERRFLMVFCRQFFFDFLFFPYNLIFRILFLLFWYQQKSFRICQCEREVSRKKN